MGEYKEVGLGKEFGKSKEGTVTIPLYSSSSCLSKSISFVEVDASCVTQHTTEWILVCYVDIDISTLLTNADWFIGALDLLCFSDWPIKHNENNIHGCHVDTNANLVSQHPKKTSNHRDPKTLQTSSVVL